MRCEVEVISPEVTVGCELEALLAGAGGLLEAVLEDGLCAFGFTGPAPGPAPGALLGGGECVFEPASGALLGGGKGGAFLGLDGFPLD